MVLSVFILFIVAFVPALIPVYSQKISKDSLRLLLVFAGTYLFAITIVHLLPEVYTEGADLHIVSILVLAGFFFQYVIDLFTSGVEHGHVHLHGSHKHSFSKVLSLLIALCIHSFLEGTILAHPGGAHAHHDNNALLLGIALHKVPASIALVSFLTCDIKSKSKCLLYALIFALASPLGIAVSGLIQTDGLLDSAFVHYLFAFVCGNFLHISTTIFFESSPEHKWNFKKLLVSILAAIVAVGIEVMA